MFSWALFNSYLFSTCITPGPNNIIALSSCSKVGFKKTIPLMAGITVGFLFICIFCCFFCSLFSKFIEKYKFPMLIIGAIYLLYLAWETFKSTGEIKEKKFNLGFMYGMTFQLINAKTWLYCIMSLSIYIIPYFNGQIFKLIFFTLFLVIYGVAFMILWGLCGSMFRVIFTKYAKITNTIMAILLVYCAISLFL